MPSVAEPPVTLQMFRGAAREILEAVASSRKAPDDVYAAQWSRLWSLLRLVRSSGPRLVPNDMGPWAIKAPDPSRPDLGQWLVGGNLWLAIVMPEGLQPEHAHLVADLPRILNAARVEPPED
jgi:hypothetical protein